ncbi:MAG: tetratricopeptide repeat protein [Gemmataceae bacterium]
MATPPARLSRRQTLGVLGVALVALVAGGWVVADQLLAARALTQGRAALAAGDAAAALSHFGRTFATRPHDPEAHFLAAVAARRSGDRAAAARHLDEADRFGWDAAAVRGERALQAAANGGHFSAVEPALRDLAGGTGSYAADALAVLATGYLAQFRITEADGLTARWVEVAPTDARAWSARTDVLERLERREASRAAFAAWVAAIPDDRRARLGLVRMMLDGRRPPAEIAPHLDWLQAATPDDPDVLRFRAAALEAEGRTDEAVSVLDRAAAQPAVTAAVLTHRARLDLDRGRADHGLPFARRAVAADASDLEARFTLLRCLQQAGTPAEAAEAEASWKQLRDDLARVRELGRRISANPSEPELRREMGELFLRNGRDSEGVRWLESALIVRPDHVPTRRLLADYYTRANRPELAAAHRTGTSP